MDAQGSRFTEGAAALTCPLREGLPQSYGAKEPVVCPRNRGTWSKTPRKQGAPTGWVITDLTVERALSIPSCCTTGAECCCWDSHV